MRLGRAGAGVVYSLTERRYRLGERVRQNERPKRMTDDELAHVLNIGSNARGIQKLSTCQRPMSRGTSARAVEQLIKHSMLPGYSTWLVPLDEGHARLLAPFEPFLAQLRKMGPCAAADPKFLRRLKRHVQLYRAAVRDLAKYERQERQIFQEARDAAIRSFLCMRTRMRELDNVTDDPQLQRLSRHAALCSAKLLEVVRSLKSLQVQVKPAPRDIAAKWAGALLPSTTCDGQPDFGGLFSWLSQNADRDAADLHTAIGLYRELVDGSSCSLSDRAPAIGAPPVNANWELVSLYPTSEATLIESYIDREPWELSDVEDFSEVREGDPASRYAGNRRTLSSGSLREDLPRGELRFIRHLWRTVGEVKVRAMLLFAMVDRWLCVDDEADELQSDFEVELVAVCRWVKTLYPGRCTLAFERKLVGLGLDMEATSPNSEIDPSQLKRLISELSRCTVRRPTEWNLDLPTPTPRRKQFWYGQ